MIIEDHEHEWTMLGPFRGKDCSRCGERVDRHLSYGQALAEKLGGDPLSYVDPHAYRDRARRRLDAGA